MTFDYSAALVQMAEGLIDRGQYREAILHLQRLVSNYPDSANAYWRLGEALLRLDKYEDAKEAFSRVLALEPDHLLAQVELERIEGKPAAIDHAFELVRRALGHSPEDAEAIAILGRLASARNKTSESLALFHKVAVMRPENAEAHQELGMAYLMAGLLGAARKSLEYALELAPEMASIQQALAVLCWKQGKTNEAFQHINEAYRLEPSDACIVKAFAVMTAGMGDLDTARETLKRYLDSVLDDNDIRSTLAQFERQVWQTNSSQGKLVTKPTDRRLIVFIGDEPRVRQAKMAYALRASGFRVVLLYMREPNFAVGDYFDEAQRYYTQWEALDLACRYAPLAFHVFSPWYDETSYTLLQHKPGKVVYDYTDVFAEIKSTDAARGMPNQQFCVERADGLCCRDLRMQHTIRRLGYKHPARVILFPDYCWDLPESPDTASQPEDGIHIVSCGSFGIEKNGQTDNGYLEIAEKFTARKIHFHLYPVRRMIGGPMSMFRHTFSDYLELAERTSFVHLHEPVPMEQVIPEMARYHIGASIVRAISYGERPKGYTEAHFQFCGSTRIFDYLDAGLPMILNRAYGFQFSLLERYGVVIDASPDMLSRADDYLSHCLSPEMRHRVRQARFDYGVRQQISRLIAFYESL